MASKPAWACGVAVVGSQWADATLMLGVTKYLKLVYGFSIEYVCCGFIIVKPSSFLNCDLGRHSAVYASYWPLFRCHSFWNCGGPRQGVWNCVYNHCQKAFCLHVFVFLTHNDLNTMIEVFLQHISLLQP